MSRSLHRALFAPLLAGALLLSACGADSEAPESVAIVESSTPVLAATTPTTPQDTTPSDTTPEKASRGKGGAKKPKSGDAEASAKEAPEADEPTSAPDPAAAEPPTLKLTKSADDTQNRVLQVVNAVETCWVGTQTYVECDGPRSLKDYGVKLVTSKRPGPGEVSVTNSSAKTFKIVGTDKEGVRWVLAKRRDGDVTRKCKLPTGKACNPATW